MSRLRLRYCTLRIIDGYSGSATVDGNPADAATTMSITFTGGIIPVGTRFEIEGVNEIYTVTAVAGSPNTTQLTFTPPLNDAGANLPTDGDAITIQGRCLVAKIGDGNFSYDTARTVEYEMDRGEIDAVVEGDDVPVNVSMDLTYEFLAAATGATVPTPKEALKKKGAAVDWVTAGADACEPYAVTLEIDYKPPCNVDHEITTLPEFRVESLNHDPQNSSLAARGQCKVADITPVRRAY